MDGQDSIRGRLMNFDKSITHSNQNEKWSKGLFKNNEGIFMNKVMTS